MAPNKITFENLTGVSVTFQREFKSNYFEEFTVAPRKKHVIYAEVFQTSETFWLLDSANERTPQNYFSTDDLDDFTGAYVTEAGGTYLLTKVPRSKTNLIASSISNMARQILTASLSIVRQFPKLFKSGKEEALPTRQSGSGSRSPQ